jgi:hypothetical protein
MKKRWTSSLGIVFRDPRPVSKVDVAFFDDLVGNLSQRTAAPLSYRDHVVL